MSRTIQVTFDCADPNALAGFWNEALGYRYDAPPPGFATWEEALDHFGVPEEDRNNASASVDPDERGPRLFFQRVPEGKTAKNRLHIDIRVAGEGPWDMAERERLIRDLWPRLEAAGATYVREEHYDGALGQVVMLDPEGNEFCVA